jgi:hypothetical protein
MTKKITKKQNNNNVPATEKNRKVKQIQEDTETRVSLKEEEFEECALLEQTEEDEGSTNSEETVGDKFVVNTGGLFFDEEILDIELPKFILNNAVKNMQSISEKSSINLIFIHNEMNTDLGKRILKAINEGFKQFKIGFLDIDGDMGSIMNFHKPRIKAVDFGALMSLRPEEPRTVQVEIEYDHFDIDDSIVE